MIQWFSLKELYCFLNLLELKICAGTRVVNSIGF